MSLSSLKLDTITEQEVEYFVPNQHGKFVKVDAFNSENVKDGLLVRDTLDAWVLGDTWIQLDTYRWVYASVIQIDPQFDNKIYPRYYVSTQLAGMAFRYLQAQTRPNIETIPISFIGRDLTSFIQFVKNNFQ